MPRPQPPTPPPARWITSTYRDVSHLHEPEATLEWNRRTNPDYELPKLTLLERFYCWRNKLSYPETVERKCVGGYQPTKSDLHLRPPPGNE